MRAHAAVGVLAVALAACGTTTAPDEAFSAGAGQAYVLVDMPFHQHETYTLTFQRVDPESSTFLPEHASITIGPSGAERWKRARKAGEDGVEPVRFGGRKLAPGHYALVSRTESAYLGYATEVNVNCHSNGAPVYRFGAGTIHVLSMPSFSVLFLPDWLSPRHDAGRQAQVDAFLAAHPNMTAPRVVTEPVGTATFATRKNSCVPQNPGTFTRAPARNW